MTVKEFYQLYKTPINFGIVNLRLDKEILGTSQDKWEEREVIIKDWELYLDHSCDEWVIGSPEDAESLKQNLTDAITFCKENQAVLEERSDE